MLHLFPGFGGIATGLGIFTGIGVYTYATKQEGNYNLDPGGKTGAFEPHLAKYIRAAEYVIGIATGSIVLLIGASALHGKGGSLPWFYASPLLLLALCVIYGILFMIWLIYQYENYQHGNPHTRFQYSLSQTLGFASLACFCTGYVWLILVVAR